MSRGVAIDFSVGCSLNQRKSCYCRRACFRHVGIIHQLNGDYTIPRRNAGRCLYLLFHPRWQSTSLTCCQSAEKHNYGAANSFFIQSWEASLQMCAWVCPHCHFFFTELKSSHLPKANGIFQAKTVLSMHPHQTFRVHRRNSCAVWWSVEHGYEINLKTHQNLQKQLENSRFPWVL